MDRSQTEVSSGLRVNIAADNAAYWSIATTMRSDSKALSAARDALGLGAAMVDVTYEGMSSVVNLMSEFKAKLVLAKEPGADRDKINTELSQLQSQMRSVAYSASFNGQNWLAMTDDNWTGFVKDRTVPGYIVRNGDDFSVGTVKVLDAIDANLGGTAQMYPLVDDTGGAATGGMGILTNVGYSQKLATGTNWVILHTLGNPDPTLGTEIKVSADTSSDDIDDMISVTEAALSDVVKWTAKLGSAETRISMQQDFASKLGDAIDTGVGRLVDADMEEVSSRSKALQTQQQLAIQSLQIANSEPQTILSLFQ
ncbi:flagellin (plasmid) [Rhizobium sp. CB3171]|uniref:flagellin N-terminal helical domain-containing protein n=1 Tax=Rhizobium sp. CB3171 TaxID=3039157 RepID=UPI0024B12C4C|nr:flagellin [Rhizobium sp. CB3171]WFU04655.1 flagellin [Rhizobium sp. CB3171]